MFKCPDFSSAELNAINTAMNTWNSVTIPDKGTIVSLRIDNDSLYVPNKIHFDISYQGWVAATYYTPSLDSGIEEIQTVEILLNTLEYYNNKGELIQFNWATNGSEKAYDIQSVVLHELGHAFGVTHCHVIETSNEEVMISPGLNAVSSCWSATCETNVMNPETEKGKIRRVLQPYDISSLQIIYWDYEVE